MLTLRLFGPPQALDEAGDPIAAVERSPKTVALLAYLATAGPGRVRRRDPVTALLWPEKEHRHARHALRQLLTRFRHAAGADCLRGDGEETLALDPDTVRCDAAAFLRALDAGRPEAALDLYGGSFLEGLHVPDSRTFERWADDKRQRYQRLATDAADRLARRARLAGDGVAERRWLDRALDLDPYSEQRSERLVELLVAAGEHGAAMDERQRLVRRFEADLGLTLHPEPLRTPFAGDGHPAATAADAVGSVAAELRRGHYHLQRWSPEAVERALVHFSRAAARDGGAPAQSGIALTYAVLGHFGHLPPDTAFRRAERSARAALDLDAGDSDAYLALGLEAHLYRRNGADARDHFGRAREAGPDRPMPYWGLAMLHLAAREYDEARHTMRRAHLLDPLSLPATVGLAWVHIAAGDTEEAERQVWDTLELDRTSPHALWQLGIIRILKGSPAAAADAFRRALDRFALDPMMLASLCYALARAGQADEARAVLGSLQDARAAGRYVPPFAFATAYAGMGDAERARRWIERGLAAHDPILPFIGPWPFTRELHDEPWFRDILDRVKSPVDS